jgi:hypothetical protein
MSMTDIPDTTGILSILGTGVAGIATGFLLLRKYLSGDSVERAGNDAQLQIIQMLQDQIKQECARAHDAIVARDEAVNQIGLLRAQVAQLSMQVESLKTQVMASGAIQNTVPDTK